jgi:pimeloyl-ACP methyl ester carboxylesterase
MLAIVISSLSASAQTLEPTEEKLIQVGYYAINMKIQRGTQDGLPTIVLESGGGISSNQWTELQPRLALETGATVVSYDRPGYGKSPLPEKPYDIVDEVNALHEVLEMLELDEKVLLVGHSYGGLLIQLFANRWPGTMQGLLFLDPNNPSAMLAMGSEALPERMSEPKTPRDLANDRIDAAGWAPFAAVYNAPLPLEVPIIVVSAETPPFSDHRQVEIFKLSHGLLAHSVYDGKHVIAEASNHMVPNQRPDLVIESVRELLNKADRD